MFTLFRESNNESVYCLTAPPPPCPDQRQPLYRSQFSCKVRNDAFCSKSGCYRTMGLPKQILCPPENYLKKHTRAPMSRRCGKVPKGESCGVQCAGDEVKQVPDCPKKVIPCCEIGKCEKTDPLDDYCGKVRLCKCLNLEQKPPIPKKVPIGIIPAGCKNYIKSNARKAICQVPKVPEMKFVDDRNGNTKSWCTSGLPRLHVNGENFGKVPCYIENFKEVMEEESLRAKEELEAQQREMRERCRHLDPTEREAILCGLKKNWEETYSEYQAMPLMIDTQAKVTKMSGLETELKKLEQDIQLLERHDHVFVADTDRSFYLA